MQFVIIVADEQITMATFRAVPLRKWRVAQAFDLAGIINTVVPRSFAFFAKGRVRNAGAKSVCSRIHDKTK